VAETKVWLVWNKDSFVWNKVLLTWKDSYVIDEAVKYKGGAPFLLEEERPWKSLEDDLTEAGAPEETVEKLLEVIVRVNGLDKKVTRLSETKNPTITVEHVRKVLSDSGREVRVVADLAKITEQKT
jgi:uncharacterized Fe-S cluster-containing radical SAM superfamily protein